MSTATLSLSELATGANVFAAIEIVKRPENEGKVIVTVGCSTRERYLHSNLGEQASKEVGA